jgi:type IV secretory pathway VirJ component
VVECTALEMRRAREGIEGSNPSLSAKTSRLLLPILAAAGLFLAGCTRPADGDGSMPVIVLPAAATQDTLVVLYSGDGGWAAIDRQIAAGLNGVGLPVIGVNSRAYFWSQRSPAGSARDLAAAIERYGSAFGVHRVILVGYSFGADALPVIVPNLPPATRSRVRLLALASVAGKGELKFHFADWFNRTHANAYPVQPALAALRGLPMVCIYGARDRHDACHTFPRDLISQVRLPGDHHFDKAYGKVVGAILSAAARAP